MRVVHAVLEARWTFLSTILCILVGEGVGLGQAGTTLFVDGSISLPSCSDYSPASRQCSDGTFTAFRSPQDAVSATAAGTVVAFRAGTYHFAPRQTLLIDRGGEPGRAVVYRSFEQELVVFKGPYDTDVDHDGVRDWDEDDGTGLATGPSDAGDRSALLTVRASHVVVSGIRLQWSYVCMQLDSVQAVEVDRVVCSDSWMAGLRVGGASSNVVVSYFAGLRVRHGSAILFIPSSTATLQEGNSVSRSLTFKNGRQLPNEQLVLPINGDPAGGGNSDGITLSKNCLPDSLTDHAMCRHPSFVENISWLNADDCYDTSSLGATFIGNVALECGPKGRVGYKVFLASNDFRYSGNLAVGLSVMNRGFELRWADGTGSPTFSAAHHNLATGALSQGMIWAGRGSQEHCAIHNNVFWGNGTVQLSNAGCITASNLVERVPPLFNTSAPSDALPAAAANAERCIEGSSGDAVEQCWRALYGSVVARYYPAADTPLVDGAAVIPGYHCQRPDPLEPESSACRHWTGAAPDLGPFEFGITGNPDRTCSARTSCARGPERTLAPTNLRLISQ